MDTNKDMFLCPICGKVYTMKKNLNRHMQSHSDMGNNTIHKCTICGKEYSRKDKLTQHYLTHAVPCPQCDKTFSNNISLQKHMVNHHTIFKCPICDKEFKYKQSYQRHLKNHNAPLNPKYTCAICGKTFIRNSYYQKHLTNHGTDNPIEENSREPVASTSSDPSTSTTPNPSTSTSDVETQQYIPKPDRIIISFECSTCTESFGTVDELRQHVENSDHSTFRNAVQVEYYIHGDRKKKVTGNDPLTNLQNMTPAEVETALTGAMKIVKFLPVGIQEHSLTIFIGEIEKDVINYIRDELKLKTNGVRWHCILTIEFVRNTNPGSKDTQAEYEYSEAHLHSTVRRTLPGDSMEMMNDSMDRAIYEIVQNFSEYRSKEGTGWQISAIKEFRLYMGKYQPLRGSQYIDLPKSIKDSKAILNIINNDNKCFMWCILAHLYPVDRHDNANRVGKYIQYEDILNFEGIIFPVSINDIVKFERLNWGITVNVFGIQPTGKKHYYYPLYISKNQSSEKVHVNLLLIEKKGKSHYCLIRDLNRMLFSQTKHKGRKHFCTNCLHGFKTNRLLEKHIELCLSHDPVTVLMPSGDSIFMKFKDYEKQLKVPYVIYADFECVLIPHITANGRTKNIHKPSGYSFIVVSSRDESVHDPDYDPTLFDMVTYSGEYVLEDFFEKLLDVCDKLVKKILSKKPIEMTPYDEAHFILNDICHICDNLIILSENKVKDHCHMTGKYRGPAHNSCNINYRLKKFIPVFFHNLQGYDGHLLMQELGKYKNRRVTCIAKNMEKYISFSLSHVRFLDSLNFMNDSLGRLVTNLAADGGEIHFNQIRKHFPNPNERALVMRKGIYPYEWMDSYEKLNATSLPEKDAFYSTLTLQDISDEDYIHAKHVWDIFNMNTMKDYHDLYLKTDVLLLADCFENFRNKCIEFYKLDPAHFYTTPGLSWSAALKMTGVTLELLGDIDMHLMIEKGVRGGVSTIVNRYCKANNKYMTPENGIEEEYDPNKSSMYILDLDANNLYGWAMSQPLPTGSFMWISDASDKEVILQRLANISPSSPEGYIFEVDLEVPRNLHDYFNEYVPAPEHYQVTKDKLSPFNKFCLEKFNLKHICGVKLIPHLEKKIKYVVHFTTLKSYIDMGIKVTQIHRILKFKQSPWLKRYIDFNTNQRKLAKNQFEKNFFKLMNNSVFGKTIENLRNRNNIELVHTEKRFIKLMSKPNLHSFQKFNEDLVGVRLKNKCLKINRPTYAGMVILDLAKLLMYDFYYNVLKKKYGDRLHLLFTDTDSLCVSIQTEDVYRDMLDMQTHLDFSDYPSDHFLHDTRNKKVLGKFKDEMNGCIILEYVGLRSKMYSIKWENGCVRTCKGINRAVNNWVLKHDMYKECLLETNYRVDNVVRIGSNKHLLYTYSNEKVSLSPFDDKRYVLDDKISTLAYGHYQICED